MGLPATTLRGDLTGTAFGGVPTWTDYTASLETGQDGQPITLTWGKQDEDDAPQPRTCEFILDNTDGRFTTGASIITTAHQFNVQVTVSGSTYDLFTGFVEDVEVLFTGTTHAQVKVSCVDLTGRLEQVELRSMVEHEMLADSPSYLYPLSEDAPSTSAADSSPNELDPAVRLDSKYGANILEFGTSMNGMFDGVNGVRFGEENLTGGATAPATVLSLPSTAFVPTSGAHTLECWYRAPDAPPSGSAFILDQGAPSSGDRRPESLSATASTSFLSSSAAEPGGGPYCARRRALSASRSSAAAVAQASAWVSAARTSSTGLSTISSPASSDGGSCSLMTDS